MMFIHPVMAFLNFYLAGIVVSYIQGSALIDMLEREQAAGGLEDWDHLELGHDVDDNGRGGGDWGSNIGSLTRGMG